MSSFDPLGPVLLNLAQHLGHNLGWAILVLSFAVRVALLPLTIRLARRAQRNQALIRSLQPEVDKLKKRFERNPERLWPEIQALYRKHECSPFDAKTFVGVLLQLPIFTLLYRAIGRGLGSGGSFGWIRDLTAPDFGLTLIIAALAFGAGLVMPGVSGNLKVLLIVLQVGVTVVMVAKLASGLALYWAASSAVGLGQAVWIRYVKP